MSGSFAPAAVTLTPWPLWPVVVVFIFLVIIGCLWKHRR